MLKPSSASLPPLPNGAGAGLCESTTRAQIPSVCCRTMQWVLQNLLTLKSTRKSTYAKISLVLSSDLLWYLVAHVSCSTNRKRKKEAN